MIFTGIQDHSEGTTTMHSMKGFLILSNFGSVFGKQREWNHS